MWKKMQTSGILIASNIVIHLQILIFAVQCLSTVNMALSDEDKILIKSLYLKGYIANTLTGEFLEESWTKCGVNKLLKKLRDTGTVDRRPVSSRPCSARTEENVETVNDLVSRRGQAADPKDCP